MQPSPTAPLVRVRKVRSVTAPRSTPTATMRPWSSSSRPISRTYGSPIGLTARRVVRELAGTVAVIPVRAAVRGAEPVVLLPRDRADALVVATVPSGPVAGYGGHVVMACAAFPAIPVSHCRLLRLLRRGRATR